MNKIKALMIEAPFRMGVPKHIAEATSKTFELLYDEAGQNKDGALRRRGETLQDCVDRLFPVFGLTASLVSHHSADKNAVNELMGLLLLASTNDSETHKMIIDQFVREDVKFVYSDILTYESATEVGVKGFWNQ